jgi:hypothetical protein
MSNARRAGRELGVHVTLRLEEDRGVARRPEELRAAARILHAQGRSRGLLAFRVADTHVHVVLASPRERAGEFARYAASALKQGLRLPVSFEPARFQSITQVKHLHHAVRYAIRQESHHGTDFDPAHDGSSVPDLLGLRDLRDIGATPELLPRLRLLLPRVTARDLEQWADLPPIGDIQPDPTLLRDAAAAAFGLSSLHGNDPTHVLARIAAVHAVSLPSPLVARILGTSPRAVQRWRRLAPAPEHVRLVQRQLRLRTALRARAPTWIPTP